MPSRTSYIIQDAYRILKDTGERTHERNDMVRTLDQVQGDLCREAMALKFEGTLALVVGQEVYDINGDVEKIVEVIEPEGWTYPLTVLHDTTVWREVRRNTELGAEQPLYIFSWERFAHLWPVPAASGEELVIYGQGLPLTTLTEDTDPEVNKRWDEALKFGLIARRDPDLRDSRGESYQAKYEREKNRVAAMEIKEITKGANVRRGWMDELNF